MEIHKIGCQLKLPHNHVPKHFIAISLVSQFLNSSCQKHKDVVIWMLKYIEGAQKNVWFINTKDIHKFVGQLEPAQIGSERLQW